MRLLLPHFREQRSGCVLNIASRAGTVAIPYSTSYCASKAALINLTACTQREMDVEGLDDVHLYSLHPGGIKSAMTLKSTDPPHLHCLPVRFSTHQEQQAKVLISHSTTPEYAKDSVATLPPQAHAFFANTLDIYNDSPYLNGMVCVALATGVGKRALRGKYFDVGQDLEDVLAQEDALRADPDLYGLHTSFLGELTNAGLPPGGYHAEDVKFEFPGF
jgi:NAD(P)-dependent dehydrogenase (short-subunit alcohol dehydrogenase family)